MHHYLQYIALTLCGTAALAMDNQPVTSQTKSSSPLYKMVTTKKKASPSPYKNLYSSSTEEQKKQLKKFLCPTCDPQKWFGTLGYFNRHLNQVHGADISDAVQEIPKQPNDTISRPWKCSLCTRSYQYNKQLFDHMSSLHRLPDQDIIKIMFPPTAAPSNEIHKMSFSFLLTQPNK